MLRHLQGEENWNSAPSVQGSFAVAIQVSELYNGAKNGEQLNMLDGLESLMGQKVEVIYEGIVYRGVLMATTDDEIFLQTLMEWISLPLERIASVKKAES